MEENERALKRIEGAAEKGPRAFSYEVKVSTDPAQSSGLIQLLLFPNMQAYTEVFRWPRFGSVTVWVWNGSGGSGFQFGRFLRERVFVCFSTF